MPAPLNTRHIRGCNRRELSNYYKTLPYHDHPDRITQQLLQAIERGSIAPITFATWLGVSKSPSAFEQALQQRFSIIVRTDAIKYLGKSLRSSRWKQIWDGLGGTIGLLDIFSNLSVHEVRAACKELGRCSKGEQVSDKRRIITELFMGFQPFEFPEASIRTTDKRPLAKYYRYLLPSCDEELVARVLSGDLKDKWQPIKDAYWMRYHPELMRNEQFRALQSDTATSINEKRLDDLANQYPKGLGTIPGFSASMDFSLSALQHLVDGESSKLDDYFVINTLARPLLHRAVKKNKVWSNIEDIVNTIMQYLQKHPSAGKEFDVTEGDVLHLVALCWTHRPDLFEEKLRKLCAHPVYGTGTYKELTDWEDFLSGIRPSRRYALLRLCFQESTGLDIDDENDLRKVKGKLSDDLLNQLEAKEALSLFTRLRVARGDDELVVIQRANTILNITCAFGSSRADCDLYEVVLQNQAGNHGEAEKLALRRLDARKQQAYSASKPEERAFYAQSALYFAVASGSPSLYQQSLKWTERFLRDPLVIRELYPRYANSYPREVIKILSGVPENIGPSEDVATVTERVQACNAILVGMFDTACAALREPSFSSSDWEGTLDLFQAVVKERINQSKKLRKALDATDEEMYGILWEHTTEMLIAVEEKANLSEFERLNANTVGGLLDRVKDSHIKLDVREQATYRFLDNLARQRDALWQGLRSVSYPTVLLLPTALPRGLPIQHLVPSWALVVPDLKGLAPFIASRVNAVIFPNPTDALQPIAEGEESTAAIGTFVDSYHYAMQLFVPKSCGHAERARRAQETWSHAIGPVSEGRMTQDEAGRFWSEVYQKNVPVWPHKATSATTNQPWPLIPEVDNPTKPHEWNPFTAGRPDKESRSLGQLTYLDLSLAVDDATPHEAKLRSRLRKCAEPQVPANQIETGAIWHSHRDMGEGGVLSALLYLEMKFGAGNGRLLEEPFPSVDDARYPSLYLAPEFDGDELNHFTAAQSIERHLDQFPATLLLHSARNMLSALAASDQNGHETDTASQELARTLIMRLAESDRPVLAHEIALQVVLDRQSASSWHRKLLNLSWFRRLPAKVANVCFGAFADAVLERMEENDKSKTKQKDLNVVKLEGSESSKSSFVKVTTIKMLAQLLQSTEFVGEDTSFSILSRLLQRASHIDVRSNALKGLLGMLDTSPQEMVEKILTVLALLVPEAGILERQLSSQSHEGEQEGSITTPGAYFIANDSSPLISAFIDHYLRCSISGDRLQTFTARVLLPALEHRMTQTAHWALEFLRKHEIDNVDFAIPLEPQDAGNILTLLEAESNRICFLPSSLLDKYIAYSLFKLAPPPAITELNLKLHNDPSLRSQRDVQTWLSLYREPTDLSGQINTFDILTLLDKPTKLSHDIGITPQIIQTHFLKLFTAALWADAPTYTHLDRFLANLLNGTYLVKTWWSAHGKPIIEAMIAYVDSVRTRAWDRNPDRQPAVLPDTFPWRLLLLEFPWPGQNDTDEGREAKCKRFADELAGVIHGMSGGIYHTKLAQLKSYLSLDPVSATADRSVQKKIGHWTIFTTRRDSVRDGLVRNRILVALHVGDISRTRLSWITKPDFLRVEVATYLLELVGEDDWEKVVDKGLREMVDARVGQWKACENEEIRRVGGEVEGKLRFELE